MKPKIVRKRNWLSEMLIVLEAAAFPLLWYLAVKDVRRAVLLGSVTYLALAWTLRLTVARHHRQGVKALISQQYEKALACFLRSEEFFTRYPWVDRLRVITMFTSSAYSYREMALMNQVHALLQLHRPAEAVDALERLLAFAPDRQDMEDMRDKLREYLARPEGCVTES